MAQLHENLHVKDVDIHSLSPKSFWILPPCPSLALLFGRLFLASLLQLAALAFLSVIVGPTMPPPSRPGQFSLESVTALPP